MQDPQIPDSLSQQLDRLGLSGPGDKPKPKPAAAIPPALDAQLARVTGAGAPVKSIDDRLRELGMPGASPISLEQLGVYVPSSKLEEAAHDAAQDVLGFAKGTTVDLAKGVGQFIASPFSPQNVEEAQNPLIRGLELNRGMTPEQLDKNYHEAIIRRATGQEADLGKTAAYAIPYIGEGLLAHDITKSVIEAPSSQARAEAMGQAFGAAVGARMITHYALKPLVARLETAVGRGVSGNELGMARSVDPDQIAQDRIARSMPGPISDKSPLDEPTYIRRERERLSGVDETGTPVTFTPAGTPAPVAKAPVMEPTAGMEVPTFIRRQSMDPVMMLRAAKLDPAHVGTTVMPGLDLMDMKNLVGEGPNRIAIFNRDDGKVDVAVYGEQSPLMEAENLRAFRKNGYWSGQDVSYNGQPYIFRSVASGLAQISPRFSPEELSIVKWSDLRRSKPDLSETKVVDKQGMPLRMYHGTERSFETFDPNRANAGSLYGPGFYHTADPDIAGEYASGQHTSTLRQAGDYYRSVLRDVASLKQRLASGDYREAIEAASPNEGPATTVITEKELRNLLRTRMEEQENIEDNIKGNVRPAYLDIKNPVDMDQTKDDKYADFLVDALNGLRQNYASASSYARIIREVTSGDLQDFAERQAGKNREVTNGDRYYGALALASEITNLDPKLDPSVWLTEKMKLAGYDGITHEGGKAMGTKPHQVWIAFDPSQIHPAPEYEGALNPGERLAYDNMLKKAREHTGLPRPLSELSLSNRIYSEERPDGSTVLRDIDTHRILGEFNTRDGAEEFINKTGQADGLDLVPPKDAGSGTPVMPPTPGKPETNATLDGMEPFKPVYNRIARMIDFFRTQTRRLTQADPYFSAVDNIYGSKISNEYRALQSANLRFQATAEPWLRRLADEIEGFSKKANLTASQRADVSAYVETMTPSEIRSSLMRRPMNQTEVNTANILASLPDADFQKALKYVRMRTEIESTSSGEALINKASDLAHSLNMTEDDLKAATLYMGVRKMDINQASMYAITRLAEATRSPAIHGLSRDAFAQVHEMTGPQLELARRVENMYKDAGEAFNIGDERLIRGYINHYASQIEPKGLSFEDAFLKQPGFMNTKEAQFISDLVRTGELNLYEKDPILALARYLRSGFQNVSGFAQQWIESSRNMAGELNQLKATNPRAYNIVGPVVAQHLAELRGIPDMGVQFAQEAFDKLLDDLGVHADVNVRKDFVNNVLTLMNGAMVGGRPALGLRHAAQTVSLYFSRFGLERTQNALSLLSSAMKNNGGMIKALRTAGRLPTISPVEFDTPAELYQSEIGKHMSALPDYIRSVSEKLLTGSTLKSVYELSHAMAYLETRDAALRELGPVAYEKDVAKATQLRAQAYKNLSINTYEPSFVKQLDELVRNGKIDDAADMLGMQTGREMVGIYGMANHPFGWGSNVGRLVGQYGMWPTWAQRYLQNMVSKGTPREIAGHVARFATTQAAMLTLGHGVGLDLGKWMMAPAFMYAGGPAVGTAWALRGALDAPTDQEKAFYRTQLKNSWRMFVPGAYAIGDYNQALNNPDVTNGAQEMARAIGIPVLKNETAWWDDYLPGVWAR